MDGMSMEVLYTAHSFPSNLSSEDDINKYAHDREHGLQGVLCPAAGTAFCIITMDEGCVSLKRRTLTLDYSVVLEGEIELHLDSGEMRTLQAGDGFVQRATMHQWKNVTKNGGKVKMAAFAQPIVTPLDLGGKELETDWTGDAA